MSNSPQPKPPSDDDDVRAIPKWADRYARSRTLAVIGMLLITVAASATVAVLCWLAGQASRHGSAIFLLYIVTMVAVLALLYWAGATGRTMGFYVLLTRRLYASDGEVVPEPLPTSEWRGSHGDWITTVVALVVLFATPQIALWVDLPLHYRQPLVAAYMVPVLAWLLLRRGVSRPLLLLWPGLYALHALLLLAGVPLPAPQQPMLTVFVPLIAYLAVAIVASHVYGRFALRKLRSLASTDGNQTTGDERR